MIEALNESVTLLYYVVITLVAFFIARFIYEYISIHKQRPNVPLRKTDWKKDVVYLYQFPRPKCTANTLPYCLKLETFLRIHDIPHEVIETFTGRSSEGKLPFAEFNGEHLPDSQLIIQRLTKHFKVDKEQSAENRARIRFITRTIDGGTFYAILYNKLGTNTADFIAAAISGYAPTMIANLLSPLVYSKVWSILNTEGTGRHTQEEVVNILRWDLEALNNTLGDKEWLVGDKPSLADCAFFGHIAASYNLPYEQPIQKLMEEFPRLKALHDRIAARYFKEISFLKCHH
jgi:glutathione S-transferase